MGLEVVFAYIKGKVFRGMYMYVCVYVSEYTEQIRSIYIRVYVCLYLYYYYRRRASAAITIIALIIRPYPADNTRALLIVKSFTFAEFIYSKGTTALQTTSTYA